MNPSGCPNSLAGDWIDTIGILDNIRSIMFSSFILSSINTHFSSPILYLEELAGRNLE
jgi:hypothetical protein